MDSAKIVVHEINRNSGNMIVDFFRESIGEASETAHPHPHGKILWFYIIVDYMVRIRVTADDLHIGADAPCGRISRFWFLGSAVYFLQLRVVNIHAESTFNRVDINAMAISCDLNATTDATSAILHKIVSPSRIASTYEIANAEFCISINRCPRPSVAPAFGFLFGAGVFRLGSDKAPNFISLKATDAKAADVGIM